MFGFVSPLFGPYTQYGWDFPEEIPETLSELFLEFPSRVRLGSPKAYNSRHLEAPEHFQNYLPPSTAGDASLFRSGSGEGLSEPVMEFPAVLRAFLTFGLRSSTPAPLGLRVMHIRNEVLVSQGSRLSLLLQNFWTPEGFLKGFWRVSEGVSEGVSKGPRTCLSQRTLQNPFRTPSRTLRKSFQKVSKS